MHFCEGIICILCIFVREYCGCNIILTNYFVYTQIYISYRKQRGTICKSTQILHMKYLCRKNLSPCIRVLLPEPNPFPRCFRLRPQLV